MARHIKIKTVNGSGTDGDLLKNYYFEESGEGYNFYEPTHPTPTQKNTSLITPANPSFSFSIPNPTPPPPPAPQTLTFSITVTAFPVMQVNGTWSDLSQESTKDVPGSGTFQAEAGGTGPIEGEEAAAAYAKAK
jgi:hypothetical protein